MAKLHMRPVRDAVRVDPHFSVASGVSAFTWRFGEAVSGVSRYGGRGPKRKHLEILDLAEARRAARE